MSGHPGANDVAASAGESGMPAAEQSDAAASILADLDTGRIRAAQPDRSVPSGWRVNADVQQSILSLFTDRTTRTWDLGGAMQFRDRVGLPVKELLDSTEARAALESGRPWRVAPGGTSVRAGVYLAPGVTIMPPSFINIGAWVSEGTMVDSHVLVGSCAQIGARVHLSAGVQIGGVLEPPGRRPVIVEDEAFLGAQAALLEGVLVRRRAVISAGVILTGTSLLYDIVNERVLVGTLDEPLTVPTGAVVVPGVRSIAGEFARSNGLALSAAVVVKYRDERTDARVALEEALR